jgi:hypothetical protein
MKPSNCSGAAAMLLFDECSILRFLVGDSLGAISQE